MFDPQMHLLSTVLAATVAKLASDSANDQAWTEARLAVQSREHEPEIVRVIDARDLAALQAMVEAWTSGKKPLPVEDREVLKRALKAYRKSLKVTRLDAESSIGGGPMSSGRQSGILGIHPPDRYPREVWDELVRQGRLLGGKQGVYELPPGT